MNKKIIGRTDFADFPELGLTEVAIKIDTGAYTSSIHCHHIRIEEKDGENILRFNILDPDHDQYHDQLFSVKNYSQKVVKNSFGESEERYIVQTIISLFGEEYSIELSLTNRDNMRFPVLLGRKILENFIVDVTQKNLSIKHQKVNANS